VGYVMNLAERISLNAKRVDQTLDRVLPKAVGPQARLHQAMRYSVFAGGKRVRPFLVMESASLALGRRLSPSNLAAAIELIHTYSLVHDDLPDMDNSDMRRGKPSCHKKFGSAMAILVGDALLTLAFQVLTDSAAKIPAKRVTQVSRMVAHAVGSFGMVGGQVEDLQSLNRRVSQATMERINLLKTGKLIAVSVTAGAVWAGAGAREVKRLERVGENIGSLFQVVDDIIDAEGYARLVGAEKAYTKAGRLRDTALNQLEVFGHKAETLRSFVHYLYERKV